MERLKSPSAFSRLYRLGRRFVGKWMEVYVAPSLQRRVGIVCKKENFRQSVQRNRVKRRLRECYRLMKGKLTQQGDMLIVAKKQMSEEPPFQEITADFLTLCQQADLVIK